MKKEIQAGNFFEFSCPEGSDVLLEEGALIPKGLPKFFVFKVESNLVKLGPLEAGTLTVDIPCSDQSTVKEEVWVKALSPTEMPPKKDTLLPEKLPFPDLSMALLFLVVFLFVLLSSYFYFRKPKAKKIDEEELLEEVLSPPEEMVRFVEKYSGGKAVFEQLDARNVHKFYDNAYKSLRAFIEFEFKLNTEFETTKEFLGTLRLISKQRGLGEKLEARIERVFEFADRVRFTAGRPHVEEQIKFYQELAAVWEKFQAGAKQ